LLIIPAIDLRGGKCVRLTQGDYNEERIYAEDPLGIAKSFVAQGATWIHVVDLDGAKAGHPVNLAIAERIANESGARIEFGGGVRTRDTAQMVLKVGISRVILGTGLVADPEKSRDLLAELGDRAIAGIDLRGGKISITGWTQDSDIEALDLAKQLEETGAKRFIVTDIATDGMLQGPNLSMIRQFSAELNSPIIASGGISSIEDLKAISEIGGVEGAIVGKALYEKRFTLSEAIASIPGPIVG